MERKTICKYDDLVAVDQYRRHPSLADLAATGRETNIVAALRIQLAVKDDEVRTLNARVHQHESTIAVLYEQFDPRSA